MEESCDKRELNESHRFGGSMASAVRVVEEDCDEEELVESDRFGDSLVGVLD